MASKNPVKGFVRCHMPDCECVATVHAVGEHRIMTEGSPPKNKRNTGRLYYNCPSCGFQQGKGANFQSYITENMKPTKAELKPIEAKQDKVLPVELKPLPSQEPKPTNNEPLEPPKLVSKRLETVKPYFHALLAIMTLFFLLRKKEQPVNG